ncbi:MAG TPA: phospho-N-acetylmuramoyl-pentapeptide-transferase [Planctomycetes bacterium]|nr:phospho-N-acetylmuramoyl-pentapeptide-transferase [Planctomycetota bacterium]
MWLWLVHHTDWLSVDLDRSMVGLGLVSLGFRAALATTIAFVGVLLAGPPVIEWLGRHVREPIKSASPQLRQLHASKAETPTMGGLLVVGVIVASVVALGDLGSRLVQALLVVTLGMFCLGAVDDLVKLRSGAGGLSGRTKLVAQTAVALGAALLVHSHFAQTPEGLACRIPLTDLSFSLGLWHVLVVTVVVVGASNAVNLTDGLDGLAGGCLLAALAAMGVVCYGLADAAWGEWFGLGRLPGAGEMLVPAGAAAGAVAAFLRFNQHPAQVFLGDTGSLPLGGLLGVIAAGCRQELLLLVVGGVFVAETLSVVLQVGWYKWRRRRVLLCAPLHHHFELLGWAERRIVARFWLAALVCALIGLASLRLGLNCGPVDRPVPEARSVGMAGGVGP